MSTHFIVIVSALIEHKDEVLILRRSLTSEHAPGGWDLCSGRIEAGETPQMAVLCEAKEETGLDVEVVAPIDAFHFYRGPGRQALQRVMSRQPKLGYRSLQGGSYAPQPCGLLT
jgi:8-oxo-dGTP pyrophosphatase MutT (NUDIX family)